MMRTRTVFCTIFWILYFPICIAFYEYVHGYVDEVMTLILICFTLIQFGGLKIKRIYVKEMQCCISVFAFYLVYSLLRQENVIPAALTDFQQQVKPYAVFYCTLFLNPQFSGVQKKIILGSILLTLVLYILMRGGKILSEEDVVLGSLSMSAGMLYYYFTKNTSWNLIVAIGIVLVGLLCGKFKYIGECVAFIGVICFMKRRIRKGGSKSIAFALVLVSAVLFFTWERFDAYYVKGMSNEELARPMMYKAAPKVLLDYFPFGPGLGTFGTFSSAKTYYSPLYEKYGLSEIWGMSKNDHGAFNADSFYPSLAQFGFVGLFFFLAFWKKRFRGINYIRDLKSHKIALMAVICLAIENAADTSYLSGRGMVYFMLLAMCLNSRQNTRFKYGNRNIV